MNQDVNILGLILDLKDHATPMLRGFSNSIRLAGRDVAQFANEFNNMEKAMEKSSKRTNGFVKNMFTGTDDVMKRKLLDSSSHIINAQTDMNKRVEERYKEFNKRMEDQSAKLHRTIMGSVALSMSGISAMNFARPILSGFGEMISQAGNYQAALTKIELTTDKFGKKTGDTLAGINSELKKTITLAGLISPMSNLQVAEGTQTMAQFGMHDSKTLKSMIAPMVQLQAISDGKLDMNQSASLLASVFNKFQLDPTANLGTAKIGGKDFEGTSMKAMEIVSMMAKGMHDAHMSADMMSSSLRAAGASMQFTNTNFAEFLSMSGSLIKAGYTPAQAGQYQQAISRSVAILQSVRAGDGKGPGKGRLEAMDKLGISEQQFSKGNPIELLLSVYDKSVEKFGANAQGIINRIFNTNGAKLIQQLAMMRELKSEGKVEMNSMEMAQDIAAAGTNGYANERMNTLLKTFPMQMEVLKGNMETLAQTIGTTLLPPINAFLEKMSNLIGKITEFSEAHPTLTKFLGAGIGLSGLLLMAGGSIMFFGGQIISAIASLNNFRLQMAMASATMADFRMEGMSAQMLLGRQGLTNVFGTLATKVLGFTAVLALGYLAWKEDIGGIKTEILALRDHAVSTWENMVGLSQAYQTGSLEAFQRQRVGLAQAGQDWYKFAKFLVDVSLVFKAVVKYWQTEQIPEDKFKILKDEGLVPILDTIFKLKTEGTAFFNGFKEGMKGILDSAKTVFGPILKTMEPLLKFFHLDGLFGGGDKPNQEGFKGLGESVGKITKYILLGVVAIKVYSKLIKGMFKLGAGGIRGGMKTWDFFSGLKEDGFKGVANKLSAAIWKGTKGILKKTLGDDAVFVAKKLETLLRAAVRAGTSGMRLVDRDRITQVPLRTRTIPWGTRPPGGGGGYRPGGQGYADWWSQNTRATSLNSRDHRELQSRAAYATTKSQRKVYDEALRLHERGRLGMNMRQIRDLAEQGGGTRRQRARLEAGRDHLNTGGDTYIPNSAVRPPRRQNAFQRFWKGWSDRSNRQGIVPGAGFRGGVGAGAGFSRFMNGMGAVGQRVGAVGRGVGRVAMSVGRGVGAVGRGVGAVGRGVGMVGRGVGRVASGVGRGVRGVSRMGGRGLRMAGGAAGMLGMAGMMFGGDKYDEEGNVIPKSAKAKALSGAAVGASMGMMLGPLGAIGGALIGGIIGGLGGPKIKAAFGNMKTQGLKALKPLWDDFITNGWPVIKNGFMTMLSTGKLIFTQIWDWAKTDGVRLLGEFWTWFTEVGLPKAGEGFKQLFIWANVEGMKKLGELADWFKDTALPSMISGLGKLLTLIFTKVQDGFADSWLGKKLGISHSAGWEDPDKKNHASGLPYVPYDNYKTSLHKGEMVLTANDADAFRKAQTVSTPSDSSSGSTSVVFEKGAVQISMANGSQAEIERAAEELFKKFMKKIENKNISNYQPSRARGFV